MSINLIVWKWSADYDTASKRRKLGVKYADVVRGFIENEAHPAMAEHDFEAFERSVEDAVGAEEIDGPYIIERCACARVFNLRADAPSSLPLIGRLAQKHGLTSAQS